MTNIEIAKTVRFQRLWLLIGISVFLRLAAAFYLGNAVEVLPGTYDQLSYDMLARRVLDGHGLSFPVMWWPYAQPDNPTSFWSFLYTSYLILIYGLTGSNPLVARLVQAFIVGLLMPWLTFRLGRRLFGPAAGLWAAGLNTIYIYFVYYAGALMTEAFYILATLAVLDQAYGLLEQPNRRNWLWLGLLLGLAIFLRQVILLFVPFLFLWLWWQGRGRLRLLDFFLPVLVIAGLILPWAVRNQYYFQEPVLLNTNAGYAFFWANHPIHGIQFKSAVEMGDAYQELIPPELRHLNEAALGNELLRLGLGFIVEDPIRYLKLSLSRIPVYFMFWPSAESSFISNMSRVSSFGLLLPLMIYGLWLGRRHWPLASLLYLFILVYSLIHLLSWALIRYRLPVDAVLILFAGLSLVDIQARLTQRQARVPYWVGNR